MSTRIDPRVYNLTLTGVPASISEDALQEIIKAAVAEASLKAKAATTTRAPKVVLRNRTIKKAGTYTCRREPSALFALSIVWPAHVAHVGCGRSFATESRRNKHEDGEGWSSKAFPNACLDRILPYDKRDTR